MVVRRRQVDDLRRARRQESLAGEGQAVAVDDARCVDRAGEQGAHRLALAADVIAVLADQHVVANDLGVASRVDARLGEREQRDQRRLRRIGRTDADALAAQIAERADRTVLARQHHAGQIAIGVAHRDRLRVAPAPAREPHRLDPGQRRAPRDVHVTAQVRLDLPLVVRIQHVVEGEPARGEPRAEALPDRHDLGVVCDRTEHQGVVAHDRLRTVAGRTRPCR